MCNMAKAVTNQKESHKHKPGDICYKCGYGIKKVSWLSISATAILGVAFGIYLAGGGHLTQEQIIMNLILILGVVTLGVLVDTRKMILNCLFDGKK